MAIDATGTPTALGIPKFNTAVDAPSGKGGNAQMDAIDLLIAAVPQKPAGIVTGETMVFNTGTNVFDRSSVTKIGTGSLSGYPWANADIAAGAAIAITKLAAGSNGDVLTTVTGVPTWQAPAASGVSILNRVAATVDITNSIAEASMFSFSVPGNTLSTNKMLRLTLFGDWLKNTTDNLTLRIKFGGTTFIADGVFASNNVANAGRFPWKLVVELANLGLTNSQWIEGTLTTEFNTTAPTTGIGDVDLGANGRTHSVGLAALGTIDTTGAQTIDVTGQWSAASVNDSWRTRYAVLELV